MFILSPMVSVEPAATPENIILFKQKAGRSEHDIWQQRCTTVNENGCGITRWSPRAAHGTANYCDFRGAQCGPLSQGEVTEKIKEQGYWSPYMQAVVDEMLNQCEMCGQKHIKTPGGHIPVP